MSLDEDPTALYRNAPSGLIRAADHNPAWPHSAREFGRVLRTW